MGSGVSLVVVVWDWDGFGEAHGLPSLSRTTPFGCLLGAGATVGGCSEGETSCSCGFFLACAAKNLSIEYLTFYYCIGF